MKRILSIIYVNFLLVGATITIVNAQQKTDFDYKVTYQLTYKPDSTRTSFVNQERMVLYVGDEFSKFSSWGSHVADSLGRYEKDNLTFNEYMAMLPETKFSYTIFKNVPDEQISFTQKIGSSKLLYSEPKSVLKWQLGNESKEIAGYSCKKATLQYAGRDYIAWFTTEIPISDGPYKFTGLPGLIVEVSDVDNEYVFSLEGFESLQKDFVYQLDLNKYVQTDKEEFMRAENKFKKNPLLAMEQSGIQIGFKSEEQKERMRKEYERKQQSRNNPIELVAVDE